MDPQKTYRSEVTRRGVPIRAVFPTPEFAALHSQMFVRHLHTDGALGTRPPADLAAVGTLGCQGFSRRQARGHSRGATYQF